MASHSLTHTMTSMPLCVAAHPRAAAPCVSLPAPARDLRAAAAAAAREPQRPRRLGQSESERRLTPVAAAPGDTGPSLAWQVQRVVSEEPQGSVYTGPSSPPPKRVTLKTLRTKYQKKEPITMVTAYDYPSAVHVST